MSKIIPLPPFKAFLASNIPSVYDNTLSYYDELTKLIAYMEELVPAVNANTEGLAELKKYVDNYFDNLDVQEEINNKLDAMAEGGQLQAIIAQFLEVAPVFAYETISDMSNATNLIAGCTARVLGNSDAYDGDGAFYLVRAKEEGETADGVQKVAVGDTLIADRIKNGDAEKIEEDIEEVRDEIDNKYNRTDNISLQNYLIYDMSTAYYSQGSCMDDNGSVYIYTSDTSYNGGSLLVFDKNTETLTNTISVNFKHGGSIVSKGNFIYAAPAISGNVFLKYNMNTGTTTSDSSLAGETSFDNCIAISDYDENHLLITLGTTDPYQSPISVAPYVFNLDDSTYRRITLTNSKNFNIGMFYALQNVCYANGHIYMLMSEPNCVLDFIVDGNEADLTKIYRIPRRDLLGLTIGEVEQLSPITGTDMFLLTAHVDEGDKSSTRTIKMYFLSFESELAQLYKNRLLTSKQSHFDIRYLDNSKTSLYEDGSETYPFKTLTRACESATHSELYTGNQVRVKSGTYPAGRLYGVNAIISLVDSSQNVLITDAGGTYLELSDCNILLNQNGGTLGISTNNKEFYIHDKSTFMIDGAATINATIRIQNSIVNLSDAIFSYSGTSKTIWVSKSANANIIVDSSTTYPTGTLFQLSSNSVLTTNISGNCTYYNASEALGAIYSRFAPGIYNPGS